ncbi:MAG: ATP-dependent 6-phosphofructokinase, partial [Propionibacteriaceae bacterium]|nr:ATP-dependent 6-phosphofructokinase [Propionibacteriaceae bacterium]
MAKTKKKVGILTAGGDAPGLNAVIRGFGKTAIWHHGMELYGFTDGIQGLVENRYVELTGSSLSGILTLGGTILGTSREKVHKYAAGGETFDAVPTIVENYERLGLEALVMLGGGGTAKNAKRLADAGLNVVSLPKTIDNDIAGTDTTFGFATAMEIATEAVDRLHSTAHSHHRIILVELMGHRAGWLTLGAGIAGGADVILIPEIPYTVKSVADTIKGRIERGSSFSVVAVAEGARDTKDAADFQAAQLLVSSAPTAEAKRAAKAHLVNVEHA